MRLHYVYPYPHVDQVLPLMAEGKILPYLDIPFQHASPSVLKAMRRPGRQEKTLDRIRSWRTICPDLAIRSTFIVGFPGETEETSSFSSIGCRKRGSPASAASNTRMSRRSCQRSPRPAAAGGEGGALCAADAASAGDQHRASG